MTRVKRWKLVKNKNTPKYASCLHQGTKVILQQNVANQFTLCPEYKALCLGQIQHITEYCSSYFQAWWWMHHVMGMLVIGKNYRGF
jgi:hypothetical protein